MGDHLAGLCVGDDRSVLVWLPLPLYQPSLPCLVLHPLYQNLWGPMCNSDQRAETICFLAVPVFFQFSLFTELTLLLQNLKSSKPMQGSSRGTRPGQGRCLLSAATGQGTTKSITGAGIPVVRVERKCPCENEACCALNPSHQSAKLKFSIAFTCINLPSLGGFWFFAHSSPSYTKQTLFWFLSIGRLYIEVCM